jgi:hypothetical protein
MSCAANCSAPRIRKAITVFILISSSETDLVEYQLSLPRP